MKLHRAGVDLSVIALRIGHESITFIHAHIALKTAALPKLQPHSRQSHAWFEPKDRLLALIDAL